jgi:hypothetical protein
MKHTKALMKHTGVNNTAKKLYKEVGAKLIPPVEVGVQFIFQQLDILPFLQICPMVHIQYTCLGKPQVHTPLFLKISLQGHTQYIYPGRPMARTQ